MTAKMAAIVLGIIFVVVGLLGFFNNPVLGLFQVNTAHNLVHLISGIVLLAGAYSSLGSGLALKIIGIVYAIVAILGFFLVSADGLLLGFIAMNPADQWLHVVLAVVILIAGFGLPEDEAKMTAM
jgi:hypothetical protein